MPVLRWQGPETPVEDLLWLQPKLKNWLRKSVFSPTKLLD